MDAEADEFSLDNLPGADGALVRDLVREFLTEFEDRAGVYPVHLVTIAFLAAADHIITENTETMQ